MKDDTIASAARRWDAARIEALALKKKRATFLCERTEKSEWGDPEAPFKTETTKPCWKTYVETVRHTYDGLDVTSEHLATEEQCASCRERYEVHLALRAAVRKRGANLRAMMALLAAERKRLGFAEDYTRPAAAIRARGTS